MRHMSFPFSLNRVPWGKHRRLVPGASIDVDGASGKSGERVNPLDAQVIVNRARKKREQDETRIVVAVPHARRTRGRPYVRVLRRR